MNREEKIKFIQSKLKHSSTRKADIPRLKHCLEVVKSDDHILSAEQTNFINELKQEQDERNKRYRKNRKTKKEQQLKEEVNTAINEYGNKLISNKPMS